MSKKKRWSVQVPITGFVVIEVEADDEESAIDAALEASPITDDIQEWEMHRYTNRGNVAYGSCTEANAEEIL